jgi:hypothetical protein
MVGLVILHANMPADHIRLLYDDHHIIIRPGMPQSPYYIDAGLLAT